MPYLRLTFTYVHGRKSWGMGIYPTVWLGGPLDHPQQNCSCGKILFIRAKRGKFGLFIICLFVSLPVWMSSLWQPWDRLCASSVSRGYIKWYIMFPVLCCTLYKQNLNITPTFRHGFTPLCMHMVCTTYYRVRKTEEVRTKCTKLICQIGMQSILIATMRILVCSSLWMIRWKFRFWRHNSHINLPL